MNDFFDKIYWINSRNRMDRFRNMIDRFKEIEVRAERFNAITGGELDHSQLRFHRSEPIFLADGRTGTQYRLLNNGEIGCFQSHVAIYRLIKEKGLDKVLILEDDAQFVEGFKERFGQMVKYIPEDWDMIYFGQSNYDYPNENWEGVERSTRNLKVNIKGEVYSADRCWLTHAYAVRGKCADFLIENTKEMYASVDNVLADIQHHLKVYAIHPALINQDGTKSSLR